MGSSGGKWRAKRAALNIEDQERTRVETDGSCSDGLTAKDGERTAKDRERTAKDRERTTRDGERTTRDGERTTRDPLPTKND
jgi:hypothetical protein